MNNEAYHMILHVGSEEMTFCFKTRSETIKLIDWLLEGAVEEIAITIWKGDKD